MAAETPEELNAQLLARIVGLEQQVVQLSARAGVARPQLPNDNEIRRVGYAAHQALRKVADAVVCPLIPPRFVAVGIAYADFHQLSDADVRAALVPRS